jgi:hypothetical protein
MGLLPHKDEERRRQREAWFRRGPLNLPGIWPNSWKGWLWWLVGWPVAIVGALWSANEIVNVTGIAMIGLLIILASVTAYIVVIFRNTLWW